MGQLFCIALFPLLAGCENSQGGGARRDSHGVAKVEAGVKKLGRDTERAFLDVGGTLEKFFTGHDTISR